MQKSAPQLERSKNYRVTKVDRISQELLFGPLYFKYYIIENYQKIVQMRIRAI